MNPAHKAYTFASRTSPVTNQSLQKSMLFPTLRKNKKSPPFTKNKTLPTLNPTDKNVMTETVDKQKGVSLDRKEGQLVTCGIFYCRDSAEINGCGSLQTSSRFDSDVLRRRQQNIPLSVSSNYKKRQKMKKYFYSDGSNNFGPFTIEELKEKGIERETNVWFHELGEWKKAGAIQELNELFALTPPPIVKQTNYNQQTIQANNSNNTIDILVFLSIAYWFFMDLINLVIRKFVDNWYESNFRYFQIGIGLIFAVVPIAFAFSIKNKTLKTVAIILCALISISIIYNNIDWLISIFKYKN